MDNRRYVDYTPFNNIIIQNIQGLNTNNRGEMFEEQFLTKTINDKLQNLEYWERIQAN